MITKIAFLIFIFVFYDRCHDPHSPQRIKTIDKMYAVDVIHLRMCIAQIRNIHIVNIVLFAICLDIFVPFRDQCPGRTSFIFRRKRRRDGVYINIYAGNQFPQFIV